MRGLPTDLLSDNPRPGSYGVLGVNVSDVTFKQALRYLVAAAAARQRSSVHFVTVHTIVEASKHEAVRAALSEATLVLPDGMPIIWMGRIQHRNTERVCGPDLMPALVDHGRTIAARHYLIGGSPGVAERLGTNLRERYPGALIVGTDSPPFRPPTDEERDQMIARINRARPDYVWVGLGSPKQDLWLAQHRAVLDAPVLLGVGAAFDMHAGDLRRAPKWMQRVGLEWLFRLSMEPRRLFVRYTVTNVRFVWLLVGSGLRALRGRHLFGE